MIDLDFDKRYELAHFDKLDKAIGKILQGLDELGVSAETMRSVMNSIAIDVPEIADH